MNSTDRPAPEAKKFASLFKAAGFQRAIEGFDFNLVRLVALARAKLRKQQLKIRLHKEKQSQQSQHRTHKAANKKAACRKETVDPLSYTANQRNKEHQTCMRRIDRKQPTAGRLCIGQPPTGGGRSLGCRYPQNKGISLGLRVCLNFGALWVLCSADIG